MTFRAWGHGIYCNIFISEHVKGTIQAFFYRRSFPSQAHFSPSSTIDNWGLLLSVPVEDESASWRVWANAKGQSQENCWDGSPVLSVLCLCGIWCGAA